VPLTNDNWDPRAAGSVLGEILLGWSWFLDLAFYRFDGDTLTGKTDGVLSGFHSDS
jgi:hypothetical protein